MGLVLGIDLGTSGPKVAVVDSDGCILDSAFESLSTSYVGQGGAEQNPAHWWQAIVSASQAIFSRSPELAARVTLVSVTAQWSGTVAIDEAGDPLMNSIVWMDSRGEKYMHDLVGGFPQVDGYNIPKALKWVHLTSGAPTKSGKDPIAHIQVIKNEFPEVYNNTHKFLEPKDYLNAKLTGKFTATYDSIHLHWVTDCRDIKNIKYHKDLLRWAGIEREKLPDLVGATDIVGTITPEVAQELGLNADVKIIGGTPDVQSALIGSGAVQDYEGHLYLGTSSWLSCHLPFKKTDMKIQMATLPGPIPGKYFLANTQENAGNCFNFLKDNILFFKNELREDTAPKDFYQQIDTIAARTKPGSNGVLFTPWLYGERTPVENSYLRSCFFNLSLKTNQDDMIRAVFEGVAYNSRWLLESVEKFNGRKMKELVVIGGGANSKVWCQILADVLGVNIRQAQDPVHCNVRGAAFLAFMAEGQLKLTDIKQRVPIVKIYSPNPKNQRIYDFMYGQYLEIYRTSKKIFERLNKRFQDGII